jgi:hypothetical protein
LGPKKYFIGYDAGIPQFIETKQKFRCVDFLSARLRSFQQSIRDMAAEIEGLPEEFFHGQKDLHAIVSGSASGVLGSLGTDITGVRCRTLSAKQYFIGYESGSPQFINGRPIYRCVDFLPAFLKVFKQGQKDLSASIRGFGAAYADLGTNIIAGHEIFSEYRDLGAILVGSATFPSSLSASIVGSYCQALTPKAYFIGYENGIPKYIQGKQRFRCVDFLPASISRVFYKDLPAYIFAQPKEERDLGAFLRQMFAGQKNLPAFLNALTYENLPAEILPVPPKDLPGYLKVWPMEHLPGRIHGWQEADLGAFIDWNDMRQLPAQIGAHPPKDIWALIKGWVREATYDLGGIIRAFQYQGLGGIIRGTYLENLPAYLFCIEPANLNGFIHGWQEADLPASLVGVYGPYDLQAYINITGEPRDLPARVKAMKAVEVASDLTAYVNPATVLMQQADLASIIAAHVPGNLGATLIPSGAAQDLSAFIYPKMVFMTTALSVSTMEHSDLGAVINFICRGSGFKNLGASVEISYLKDLAAQITGKKIPMNQYNLGASVGYAANYVYTDRVPISLTVGTGYRIEDKIPILLSIYKQQAYLSAAITGTYRYNDLGVTITPTWLEEYEFDNVKTRQIVYDLNHARQVNWYEVVDLYFKSIVSEYFYVGAQNKVYKSDRTARWILELTSYVPENVALNISRKLHRVKDIYDLTKFNNLDEAIRFAIHYVTSYDYGDLQCAITPTPLSYTPKTFNTENNGLNATISPQHKTFVLGYDNKVEFISQ